MKRFLLLGAALLALAACGGTTGAERVSLPLTFGPAVRATGPNEMGWTVQLTRAEANVGALRFFSGAVLLSSRWRFDPWLLVGGIAHAHPGHYEPGEAMGELVQQKVVDLLATEPLALGTVSGVTGQWNSASIELLPRSGNAIHLTGTATHTDGRSVKFDAAIDPATPIVGIASVATVVAGQSPEVNVAPLLGGWLARIDFGSAGVPDGSGVVHFDDGSQARNALFRGIEDTSQYRFTWKGTSP